MSNVETPDSLRTLVSKRPDNGMIGGKVVADGFYFAPRYSRRLEDKILIALHHACDQGEDEVAEALLQVLETIVSRKKGSTETTRRHAATSLVAAHERIGILRHRPPAAPPSDAPVPGRLVERYIAEEDPALFAASSGSARREHPWSVGEAVLDAI